MSPLFALKKGQLFGRWRLMEFLGEGGNGFVWSAQDSEGNQAAIKILAKLEGRSSKVYERFKHEVNIVQKNQDIDGILPVSDFYLPDEIHDEHPWYAMPVAQTLENKLTGKNVEDVVNIIIQIGETLRQLHDKGISHRDIKPANILVLGDRCYIGDFGLADYSDKVDLTSSGEQIGAKWTIAPEMKRDGNRADGKCADVYSLAKTLWILLTGQKLGFDGQYDPNSVNGLSRFELSLPEDPRYSFRKSPPVYLGSLEDLLIDSTNDYPSERPTMKEFLERLHEWVGTYRIFKRRNPLEWRDVQLKLFPFSVPQRVIWGSNDQIIQVLNLLGSIDNLNHMFLPKGGGMDMLGASLGNEKNTIELVIGERHVYVVRPKRLIFESFGLDWEWNYFRLESGDLESIKNDNSGQKHVYEELVEIEPGHYIDRAYWDEGEYNGRELSRESRLVSRYIKGDFVIFQKTSMYNQINATYTGIHNHLDTDEFREYIENKIHEIRDLRNRKELLDYAKENGSSIDEIVKEIMNKKFNADYQQLSQELM